MVWRARRAAAGFELGVAERAHHLLLELRGLAIRGDRDPGREAPRAVCQRLGRCAGERAAHSGADCACKSDPTPKQRAAIDEAITGDRFERRGFTAAAPLMY